MQLLASVGRVVIRPIKEDNSIGGFEVSNAQPRWGEVVDLGPPMPEMWTEYAMKIWDSQNVHPIGYGVGNKVLLPKVGTQINELQIFWQHDIPAWHK